MRFRCAIAVLVSVSVLAQQPPLTAQDVKDRLNRIGVGNKLTVETINGDEYHGSLRSMEPQTFSMQEVDLKATKTISYTEVKRVSKNYGGKTVSGHRVSYRRHWITFVVITAGFIALVIVAAAELGKA
jgi:small nuclear ribonucleoprotein (snRNP)-like protein